MTTGAILRFVGQLVEEAGRIADGDIDPRRIGELIATGACDLGCVEAVRDALTPEAIDRVQQRREEALRAKIPAGGG